MTAFITFLSFYIQSLSINIGFFLKPYMMVGFLLALRFRGIANLFAYELVFIVFSLLYACTSLYSGDTEYALRMVLGIYLFVFMFFVFREYFGRYFFCRSLLLLGWVFSVLSFIWYVIGFREMSTLNNHNPASFGLFFDRGMFRMRGFSNNPDYFNIFNAIFIMYAWENLNKKWAKGLFILALTNSFLTFSLSAILSLVVGFVSSFFLGGRKKDGNKLIVLIVLVLLALPVIFYFYDMAMYLLEARSGHLETGSGRFGMWAFILSIVKENIFFGVGLGGLAEYTKNGFDIVNAHNTYLTILAEGGIFVFLLFLTFQMLLFGQLALSLRVGVEVKYLFLTLVVVFTNMFFVDALIHESFLFVLLVSYAEFKRARCG